MIGISVFLVIAFLFFIGSLIGWGIEVIFRKFFSGSNPEHKWINPGVMTGPYVPLYGFGLVLLYLIASLESFSMISDPAWNRVVLFAFMAVCMTLIEYIAGIMSIKFMKVKLWDYSRRWGNIQGIICPLFSLFWALLGAVYYFFVHPHILDALAWLSRNLAFSFVIGFFYGVFILDFVHSTNLLVTIRRFADEKQIIIRYEELRDDIRRSRESRLIRASFLFSMRSDMPIIEHLSEYYERKKQSLGEQLKAKLPKKRDTGSKNGTK